MCVHILPILDSLFSQRLFLKKCTNVNKTSVSNKSFSLLLHFVGNKAEGRISKLVITRTQSRILHAEFCVSGGKKCSFFKKIGLLCFLVTPVLGFAFLPY